MAQASGSHSPVSIVFGGDEYLNERVAHDLYRNARQARPDSEHIELDASDADQYGFDEAVGPSLLSETAIVTITNLQNADDRLVEAVVSYCAEAAHDPEHASIVIARHDGGVKGRKFVDRLVRAGAWEEKVPDLKKPEAKLNFAMQCFERRQRRVEPLAVQQLVAVLGDATAELAAMCSQLCFDFDDDPISLDLVNQYLTANPQVNGFFVADKAVQGRTAEAIIAMRSAIGQGTDPIALIGALAMKLRTIAKASAVRSGKITKAEAKTNPWVLNNAMRQVSGWTSEGLSHCLMSLAWADEQSKSSGGDPVYALERSVELIGSKGREA